MIDTSLKYLKFLGSRNDDDSVDRLHYFFTSNFLIMLSLIISYKQFGGRPIECLTPKIFPKSWEDYAENYCWAKDTYVVSFDEDMPNAGRRYTPSRRISYYQWVPFFLLFQACCFRLPCLIWKHLATQSGVRIDDIVKVSIDEHNLDPQIKQQHIKSLTNHLENALHFQSRSFQRHLKPFNHCLLSNVLYSANYVSTFYLITKLLYTFNVVSQLALMNSFLVDKDSKYYGFDAIVKGNISGSFWRNSRIFPRVTMCDFKVRSMGNVQDYSVQCVLVINIFNEKIFILLWFWYIILLALTVTSLIFWLSLSAFPKLSINFISNHLELSEMPFDPKGSAKQVSRFVRNYLRTDGVFIIRMITNHSGIIFGSDLVLSLWQTFYCYEEKLTLNQKISLNLVPNENSTEKEPSHENIVNILKMRKSDDTVINRKGAKENRNELDGLLSDIVVSN